MHVPVVTALSQDELFTLQSDRHLEFSVAFFVTADSATTGFKVHSKLTDRKKSHQTNLTKANQKKHFGRLKFVCTINFFDVCLRSNAGKDPRTSEYTSSTHLLDTAEPEFTRCCTSNTNSVESLCNVFLFCNEGCCCAVSKAYEYVIGTVVH